jgi:hypothetical protein
MLRTISRASFQRSSTAHFGTSLAGRTQAAPPPANHCIGLLVGGDLSTSRTPRAFLPFNRFRRSKLAVCVWFEAWSTCLQYTTVPGSNAARWARDGGELFLGQVSLSHWFRLRQGEPVWNSFLASALLHCLGFFPALRERDGLLSTIGSSREVGIASAPGPLPASVSRLPAQVVGATDGICCQASRQPTNRDIRDRGILGTE